MWCGWSQNNLCGVSGNLCGEGGDRTTCVVWVVTQQVTINTWCVISMPTHKLLLVRAEGT